MCSIVGGLCSCTAAMVMPKVCHISDRAELVARILCYVPTLLLG